MSEAVVGFVGVIVGGLISIAGGWLARRERLRREIKVARRLVVSELSVAHAFLTDATRNNGWYQSALNSSNWLAHRATLAAGQSKAVWQAVEGAYADLAQAERTRSAGGGDWSEGSVFRVRLSEIILSVESAQRLFEEGTPDPPDLFGMMAGHKGS